MRNGLLILLMSVSRLPIQRDLSSFFNKIPAKDLSLQELIVFAMGMNQNHLTFDHLYLWLNRHFRKIPSVMNYLPPAKTVSQVIRKLVDNDVIEYRYMDGKYLLQLTMRGLAQYDILEQRITI